MAIEFIPPAYCFMIGVMFCIIEIFTFTFASVWFGLSAFVVAFLTWQFPHTMHSWLMQFAVWIIFSILIAISWFKIIQPSWSIIKKQRGLKNEELIGEQGIIVKIPRAEKFGIIRFHVPVCGDSEWKCRIEDDNIEHIKIGDHIKVIAIEKKNLVVRLINR